MTKKAAAPRKTAASRKTATARKSAAPRKTAAPRRPTAAELVRLEQLRRAEERQEGDPQKFLIGVIFAVTLAYFILVPPPSDRPASEVAPAALAAPAAR